MAQQYARRRTAPPHILIGDGTYTWADLILPDGGRVHFVRTSGGMGYASAVMEHIETPSQFFKATLRWNNARAVWDLTRRDCATLRHHYRFVRKVRIFECQLARRRRGLSR